MPKESVTIDVELLDNEEATEVKNFYEYIFQAPREVTDGLFGDYEKIYIDDEYYLSNKRFDHFIDCDDGVAVENGYYVVISCDGCAIYINTRFYDKWMGKNRRLVEEFVEPDTKKLTRGLLPEERHFILGDKQ